MYVGDVPVSVAKGWNNQMKKRAFKDYVLYIAIIAFFCMLLFVGLQKHTYTGFHTDVAMTYNQGWQQVNEDGNIFNVSVPGELDFDGKNEIVLQHELPQHIMSGLSICVWVNGQSIQAEIDGESMLSYGMDNRYLFGKNFGSYWYMLRLPEAVKGKLLKLTLTSPYEKQQYYMEHIYIGNQTALLFMLFEKYGIGLFLAVLLTFIGVLITVAAFVFRKNIMKEDMQQMRYLGWFSILLGMWLFVQSRMAQFFVGNNFALLLVYYMGMMLFPIPLLYFMAHIRGNHLRHPLMGLACLFLINFIVCSILQFADVRDYSLTIYSTGILMIIALILMLINAIVELHYRNKEFIPIALGIYFLAFFSAIELWGIVYRQNHWIGDYVRYGMFCLLAALLYKAARNIVNTVETAKTAAYYEQLATIDLMANCYSRTAYNQDVEKLSKGGMEGICVLLFDVNNLKNINDTYGHLAGDKAIKTCALCIRKVFDRVGKVYRIGGDEFTVIISQCDKNILLQRLAVFQRLVLEQDKRLEFTFQVAWGYAIYNPHKDNRIEDLIHRADASMYGRKQKMKGE